MICSKKLNNFVVRNVNKSNDKRFYGTAPLSNLEKAKIRSEMMIDWNSEIEKWKTVLPSEKSSENFNPTIGENEVDIACRALEKLDHQDQTNEAFNLYKYVVSNFEIEAKTKMKLHESIISYCCRSQLLMNAEQMLRKLRIKKVQITPTIYKDIITLAGRFKNKESIDYLYNCWKEDYLVEENSEQLQVENENYEIIKTFYLITIFAYAKAKAIERSHEVFKSAIKKYPKNYSLYLVIVQSFCHVNRIESSLDILKDAYIDMIPIQLDIVHITLEACARLGNFFLAERIFKDISAFYRLEYTIDTWNHLFKCYFNSKDMSTLHFRFMDMLKGSEIRPNFKTYEIIIMGNVKDKNHNSSYQLFQHMISHNVEPNDWIYGWVIEGFVNAKLWEKAYELIAEMQSKNLKLHNKFRNLILIKSKKSGQVELYENAFGPIPEPFDDLKELKQQVLIKKKLNEEKKSLKKLKLKEKKKSIIESNVVEKNIQTQNKDDETKDFEQIVEEDEDVSFEDWMKDDIGKDGWKNTSINLNEKKKFLKNAKYESVFEASGWKNSADVNGPFNPKEWNIVDDPLSVPRPHVATKKKIIKQNFERMERFQNEAVNQYEKMEKERLLEEQERRRKAYGTTRFYGPRPEKSKKPKKNIGSSFSFR